MLKPEVESSISESVRKRDKFFTADQKTLGSALSALGTGLSILFRSKYEERERPKAMKCLLGAGKLLSESYYQMSKTRKVFVYPSLDRKAKEVLKRGKSDSFLFGQELSTSLKSAKSMEKVGLTLKPSQRAKKPPLKPMQSGNWKPSSVRNQGYSQPGDKTREAPFIILHSAANSIR